MLKLTAQNCTLDFAELVLWFPFVELLIRELHERRLQRKVQQRHHLGFCFNRGNVLILAILSLPPMVVVEDPGHYGFSILEAKTMTFT